MEEEQAEEMEEDMIEDDMGEETGEYAGLMDATFVGDESVATYLIPLLDWEDHGEEELLSSPELEDYYVGSTTFEATILEGTQILVAECPSGVAWREIRPRYGIEDVFDVACE